MAEVRPVTAVEDVQATVNSLGALFDVTQDVSEVSASKDARNEVSASKDGRKLPDGPPLFMYLMAGCAALNSTNIGFDIGASTGVALLLQEEWQLTDGQVGLFMGSFSFVAAFGGLSSQAVSDRLGRRWTFAVTQVVLLVGLAIMASAVSFGMLMVGRVFVGLAVGFGLAVDPLYITELAPAQHRGRLTSWPEIATNLGILLGFVVNWAFADIDHAISWRLMLAVGGILPIALLVLSLKVMPESPRWLISKGRVEEATLVLRSSHPQNEDIAAVVEAIQSEISEEQLNESSGWAPLFCPDKVTKRLLLIGIGVAFSQQISGVDCVLAYSPTIFKRAHVATSEQSLFALTMLVGFTKTAFIVLAACYMDTKGRRPLLILSTTAMTVCLATLALAMGLDISWLSVVAVCSYVAAFSLGMGPITWIIAAEVFPSQIRAKAMSLATFTNRMTSGMLTLTFLPLSDAMGGQAQYFGLLAVLTGLTAVFACVVVPETKQMTLEQLHQHIGRMVHRADPQGESRI
ncbi:unnamed protein product [Polarella glacialis]|uniref:Hexose transporter 1 n=1 Tax=Polarella glacialis TaxID=89957 RepID=A0A813GE15_POLGL|nr:unnamed protein product [Polarella glacialis]